MSGLAVVRRMWAVEGERPHRAANRPGGESHFREGERKGPQRDEGWRPRAGVEAERLRPCRTFAPRVAEERAAEAELGGRVAAETAFYRKYTEGMLRRYMRMSLEMGRVPSMLGKELFRGKVTSYRVKSFEDVIIFVHDVEKCLAKLDATSLQLIGRISLQEYTQGEAAGLTGMSLRSVTRKYGDALDRLTVVFLEHDLLERQMEMGCQGGRAVR